MLSMIPNELKKYIPIAQAITALLHPFGEVVLHDLRIGRVVAIFNNFSKRDPGEDSLVEIGKPYPDYFEPYYKTNWDGRRLKSTTATLRDEKGEAIGLLCVNLDVSGLETLQGAIQNFLSKTELPSALFNDDWREKISTFVHNWLKEKKCHLGRAEKRELIHELWKQGAFRAKHAASYVAQVLDLSRATVFKYLKTSVLG